MQLSFPKIFQICKNGEKVPFFVKSDDYKTSLEGVLSYDGAYSNFIKLNGILKGKITLVCDASGEEYEKTLDESLEFYLSDGMVHLNNESFEEIIECENGKIDLNEILRSELEMICCDYHRKDDSF